MKKRALSILLALLLSLTSCDTNTAAANTEPVPPAQGAETTTPAAKVGSFSDVPADADYAQAVEWCREQGLMGGVGGDRFDPEGVLTRATLATVLYRAEKAPAVTAAPNFPDTKAGTWYSDAVVWAHDRGIILGYGNGLFGTNDPVSVEQLEVILGRYTGNGPEWVGDPQRAHAATRAQVAVALYNALKVPAKEAGKTLVAYFSCTGNTKSVAETVQAVTGGDLFEIVPAEPYTDTDLNYNTDCRANREQNDSAARPAIADACVVEDMDAYDVVFLGYPIWWGIPPKIMRTFVESYDLSGKTVVPFCTSGGSGFSDEGLSELAPDADWRAGRRLNGASQTDVEEWVAGLNLPKQEENTMKQITLSFNGHTYSATLADNSAVDAFVALIRENGGSLTISASDYGGWEKVGSLGQSLPRSDAQTTTNAGDFVLYSGDQIVLFYGSNSWSYTRLGRIDDPSGLREALGDGGVEITFQLAGEDVGPFDLAAGQVTLNSGYVMPINGLGTYSLTGETCVNSVKAALESGVRLIDTAYMYHNEAEVGRAIRESGIPREEIFVITKLYPGSQYADPEQAIQDALDKLDIGYIDMMLLHHPGENDVKAYRAMEQAVADGKIRSIGLSKLVCGGAGGVSAPGDHHPGPGTKRDTPLLSGKRRHPLHPGKGHRGPGLVSAGRPGTHSGAAGG